MRNRLTPARIAIIKTRDKKCWWKCREKETLYTVGGNVNWYSHYRKHSFSEKLKIELPRDPAIPHLGIFQEEMKWGSQRDICPPVFTVALFIIAELCKQPKFLSMDEWVENMWRSVSLCVWWNIIYSWERRRSCHLQQHGWFMRTLSEISQRSTNIVWSYRNRIEWFSGAVE